MTVHLGLPEVRPDFPREHLEFVDPADDAHLVRADLTWLLSAWTCVFGSGCAGVVQGRAEDGCCSHGAFYSDEADEARVSQSAAELTSQDWEHAEAGRCSGISEVDELEQMPARRTRTVDGACVFLNRPGFAAGGGCALHALAVRTGRHPLETKPDVCWQLPVRREQEWVDRPDETRVLVTSLGEFDRRGWGPGGAELHWWCTSSPQAHVGTTPLYLAYGPELAALVGRPAYDELVRLVGLRGAGGLEHPATAAARTAGLAGTPAARLAGVQPGGAEPARSQASNL